MSSALENLPQQDLAEEIEAINAIYDPETIELDTTANRGNAPRILDLGGVTTTPDTSTPAPLSTTIRLRIPGHPDLSFLVGFDDDYPTTPPRVIATASTSARGEGSRALYVLRDIVSRTHHPGQVCLFEIIGEASDKFSELQIGGSVGHAETLSSIDQAKEEGSHEGRAAKEKSGESSEHLGDLVLKEILGVCNPPDWTLSDVVTEKKSVFVGRAVSVSSREQARAYIDYLLATDKKVASATHNITAWRIREKCHDSPERTFQDSDDDGETAAGGRLLHLMQLMDVWDVLVVVTRWYGGVLLGPDRFRIINNVGKDALVKAGFHKDTTSAKDKGKKKGKR